MNQTTKKMLRSFFKTELNLNPSVNIRTIMKTIGAESKEECYIIMSECYNQVLLIESKHRDELPVTQVKNRYYDLPNELIDIIQSYKPLHIIDKFFQPYHKRFEEFKEKANSNFKNKHYAFKDFKEEYYESNELSLMKIVFSDTTYNPTKQYIGDIKYDKYKCYNSYKEDIKIVKRYNIDEFSTNEDIIKKLVKLKINYKRNLSAWASYNYQVNYKNNSAIYKEWDTWKECIEKTFRDYKPYSHKYHPHIHNVADKTFNEGRNKLFSSLL